MPTKDESKAIEKRLIEIIEHGRPTACEELETLFEERKGDIPKHVVDTAIHAVCQHYKTLPGNYVDMLSILLRKNGDPNSKIPSSGLTPLMVCSNKGIVDLLDCLVKHPKTRIDQVDKAGRSALMYAIDSDHGENSNVMSALVTANANVNQIDKNGNTPLVIAIQRGYFETVKYLLENHANPRCRTPSGDDLQTMAMKLNFPKIKDLLDTHLKGFDYLSQQAVGSDTNMSNLGSIDLEHSNSIPPYGPNQAPAPARGAGQPSRPAMPPPTHGKNQKQPPENVGVFPMGPHQGSHPGGRNPQDWKHMQGGNQIMDLLDFPDHPRGGEFKGDMSGFIPGQMPPYGQHYFVPQPGAPYGVKQPKNRGQKSGMPVDMNHMPGVMHMGGGHMGPRPLHME